MVRSVEATAKTIEDAINKAYELLGVDRDTADASVEVIDRPKSGFLGFGSVPAKVRISVEEPDPIPEKPKAEKPARKEKPAEPKAEKPAAEPAKKQERKPRPERKPAEPKADAPKNEAPKAEKPAAPKAEAPVKREPTDPDKAIATATAFLEGLLERMHAKAHPEMKFNEEGTLTVELIGEELGMLIGRRGETLNAIQHITSYVVNKERNDRVRVTVDVENYRGKREEALQKLAHKTALKVVRYRRNISLEPMNAYERHVIHTALQDWRDVSTFSSGSEPRRCVVISYTPGNGGGAGEKRAPRKNSSAENAGENKAAENGENTAPRAPRENRGNGNRGGNRRGGRGGRGGNGGNRAPKAPVERPKSKPLEEQVWE